MSGFARTVLDQARPGEVPEELLQAAIVDLALDAGYLVFYLPDALLRIAAQLDRYDAMPLAGFPDLVLGGHGRLLMVECKSQRGRLRGNQVAWSDRILDAGGDWRLWRPSDWPSIRELLGDA
jgi:hypothetical protein